jgi:hypothetical protein
LLKKFSRKGVKVVLGDVKTQCELMIADIENPTEVELLAVQEYFMNNASQLTVINNDVDTVDSVDNPINTASIQDTDSSDLYINEAALTTEEETAIAPNTPEELEEFYKHPALFTPNQDDQPAPLATATKSELITTTANQMGIVLDASEISLIAENINHSSDDFDQDIDAIKSAIMAFVQHKAMVNQSKINQMIDEVREVVGTKNQENSQLLTDGLRSINQDIQEANKKLQYQPLKQAKPLAFRINPTYLLIGLILISGLVIVDQLRYGSRIIKPTHRYFTDPNIYLELSK